MKTAISIPDQIFRRVEAAAKRLGLSRSELFTRAAVEFLKVHSPEAVTALTTEPLLSLNPIGTWPSSDVASPA